MRLASLLPKAVGQGGRIIPLRAGRLLVRRLHPRHRHLVRHRRRQRPLEGRAPLLWCPPRAAAPLLVARPRRAPRVGGGCHRHHHAPLAAPLARRAAPHLPHRRRHPDRNHAPRRAVRAARGPGRRHLRRLPHRRVCKRTVVPPGRGKLLHDHERRPRRAPRPRDGVCVPDLHPHAVERDVPADARPDAAPLPVRPRRCDDPLPPRGRLWVLHLWLARPLQHPLLVPRLAHHQRGADRPLLRHHLLLPDPSHGTPPVDRLHRRRGAQDVLRRRGGGQGHRPAPGVDRGRGHAGSARQLG
mmetsp:Transcript_22508/g.67150  ORF Transcript_22508/g.67150 Transcript_22508/m.67150 type:complete len:299 (-) Transcript_22508:368-1264(-)